ncbi:cation-chloride cotransporter 2-like [Dorcoceras hygrometricum]|uniref:Cation-chloride cotransporter 2-like n=1 Tax=Dorcoceras hygrometricum TaxID=472368 RepID=A0A2Z7CHI5_9LAMI|nr:cation-chloride cotransporter 2-like [Dorcoceras hygrometricum]
MHVGVNALLSRIHRRPYCVDMLSEEIYCDKYLARVLDVLRIKWVYLVAHAMSLLIPKIYCMAIEFLVTLDLSMVVDTVGIFEIKGPYFLLIMVEWFLQTLSVIPRESFADAARRFIMLVVAVIAACSHRALPCEVHCDRSVCDHSLYFLVQGSEGVGNRSWTGLGVDRSSTFWISPQIIKSKLIAPPSFVMLTLSSLFCIIIITVFGAG